MRHPDPLGKLESCYDHSLANTYKLYAAGVKLAFDPLGDIEALSRVNLVEEGRVVYRDTVSPTGPPLRKR